MLMNRLICNVFHINKGAIFKKIGGFKWGQTRKQKAQEQPSFHYSSLSSSLASEMSASESKTMEAAEAAKTSTFLITFAGSMTPALIRSSIVPVSALKPKFFGAFN